MSKRDRNFNITGGKGFYMKFANGYGISVQFGPGNYCDHYDRDIGREEATCGAEGSNTAECAVIAPGGGLVDLPKWAARDTVTNRSQPDEVLRLMAWAARQKVPVPA